MAAVSALRPPSYTGPISELQPDSQQGNELPPESSLLPTYTAVTQSHGATPIGGASLSPVKEFTFDVDRRGKTFAALTILGNGELSNTIPTIVEERPIKGSVHLMLDKTEAFQGVTVRVQGKLLCGPLEGDQISFLDILHTIWLPSMGDPRESATRFIPRSPNSSDDSTAPFVGKFAKGEYSWDFSIDLPRDVVVPAGPHRLPKTFKLPQTFAERHVRASVAYSMTMKIVTNSFLSQNHRAIAQLGFIPFMRAPTFPRLRLLAYQEGSTLLPPSFDPDGWHACRSISFKGLLFKNRMVELECKLYLAKPLVFTRSTHIPLYLELLCTDTQALSLLSSLKAVSCRLRRFVKFNDAPTQRSQGLQNTAMLSQPAVWWKPDHEPADTKDSAHHACLIGELHLGSNLKPTTALAWFEISYSVVLLPFDVAGFDADISTPLVIEPVEIVTAFAPGARPRKYAPPGYETEVAMYPDVPQIKGVAAMLGMSDSMFG